MPFQELRPARGSDRRSQARFRKAAGGAISWAGAKGSAAGAKRPERGRGEVGPVRHVETQPCGTGFGLAGCCQVRIPTRPSDRVLSALTRGPGGVQSNAELEYDICGPEVHRQRL